MREIVVNPYGIKDRLYTIARKEGSAVKDWPAAARRLAKRYRDSSIAYDDIVTQKDEHGGMKLNDLQIGKALQHLMKGESIGDAIAKVKQNRKQKSKAKKRSSGKRSARRNVAMDSEDDDESELNVVEEPRRKRRKIIEDSEDDD